MFENLETWFETSKAIPSLEIHYQPLIGIFKSQGSCRFFECFYYEDDDGSGVWSIICGLDSDGEFESKDFFEPKFWMLAPEFLL